MVLWQPRRSSQWGWPACGLRGRRLAVGVRLCAEGVEQPPAPLPGSSPPNTPRPRQSCHAGAHCPELTKLPFPLFKTAYFVTYSFTSVGNLNDHLYTSQEKRSTYRQSPPWGQLAVGSGSGHLCLALAESLLVGGTFRSLGGAVVASRARPSSGRLGAGRCPAPPPRGRGVPHLRTAEDACPTPCHWLSRVQRMWKFRCSGI